MVHYKNRSKPIESGNVCMFDIISVALGISYASEYEYW